MHIACTYGSTDVSVGVLNAALNTSQWDDQRLCAPACNVGGIAFYNISCNGLCNMRLLHELHANEACSGPGTGKVSYQRCVVQNTSACPFHTAHVAPDGLIALWQPQVEFVRLDKLGHELERSR